MRLVELLPSLQAAVGPVILISGVGLVLLSMTNRFGRVLDRARKTLDLKRHAASSPDDRARIGSELEILYGRARLLRLAITFAIISVLSAALLIVVLFVGTVEQVEFGNWAAGLFIACMFSLIVAMILFLLDINRSLAALRIQLDGTD